MVYASIASVRPNFAQMLDQIKAERYRMEGETSSERAISANASRHPYMSLNGDFPCLLTRILLMVRAMPSL